MTSPVRTAVRIRNSSARAAIRSCRAAFRNLRTRHREGRDDARPFEPCCEPGAACRDDRAIAPGYHPPIAANGSPIEDGLDPPSAGSASPILSASSAREPSSRAQRRRPAPATSRKPGSHRRSACSAIGSPGRIELLLVALRPPGCDRVDPVMTHPAAFRRAFCVPRRGQSCERLPGHLAGSAIQHEP